MNPLFEQLLYKAHSNGKVGTWSVRVTDEGTHALMTVASAKVIGGKEVVTPTQYKVGKNIGRANETTPLKQAVLEAMSKVSKKLDNGYLEDMPEEGSVAKNGLGLIKPMLAKPLEDVKNWDYPVMVQPKLDGHRMLATAIDGKVTLYSRQAKVLNVAHIQEELQAIYDAGIWSGNTIDGELYLHGESLQNIGSLIKKPKPESINLRYHVYDTDTEYCYQDRSTALWHTFCAADSKGLTQYWRTVPYLTCRDEEFLNQSHTEYLDQGYEGTMVRQFDIGYEQGKRSSSLMKKKTFQDAEFEIIGSLRGKPNVRQGTEVGIYRCRTDSGVEFQVTAPGNAQEKHTHALEGKQNIGKHLTVQFFNLTADGCPFHPVALRIREDV